MPTNIQIKSGVQVIFDGTNSATPISVDTGRGALYTIVCTGTVGQNGKLQGSIDNVKWVDIVEFVIESSSVAMSEALQFCYPYLQVSGTATLKIVRSIQA